MYHVRHFLQLTIEHEPETNISRLRRQSAPLQNVLRAGAEVLSQKLAATFPRDGKFTRDRERIERMFKSATLGRQRQRLRSSRGSRERASSMPRLLDSSCLDGEPTGGGNHSNNHRLAVPGDREEEDCELSRTQSFRVDPRSRRSVHSQIFRASDLVQGELLGMGFFGRVFRVTHRETSQVYVLKELYRVDEEAQTNFLKEVLSIE